MKGENFYDIPAGFSDVAEECRSRRASDAAFAVKDKYAATMVIRHPCACCRGTGLVAGPQIISVLESLLDMLDDPHGEPGEAEQVIMHARNAVEGVKRNA